MKKSTSLLYLILLLVVGKLYAADSLQVQVTQLSHTVIQQIKANQVNNRTGNSRHNNYVVGYTPDVPPPYQELVRNNGKYFWQDITEEAKSTINTSIKNKSSLLGSTGYYVVVASVFKYADTGNEDFEANENIDWTHVKKQNATTVTANDAEKNRTFLNRVFEYVKKEVAVQTGSTDFLINYFLTVFSVGSDGKYKISYRTYIQYGSQLSNLAEGFPALDKQLIDNARYNKVQWILNNLTSDADLVALYKANKGDLTVMDYSKQLGAGEVSALRELFGGKKPIKDAKGITRHTLKCRLLISKQGTPDYTTDTSYINRFQPPENQLAIWIDFNGNTPEVKWVKLGGDGMKRTYEEALKALQQDPKNFWQRFIASLPKASFAEMCGALYEMMDWVARGIKYLEIPSYAWNCDDANYKATYSDAFNFILKPLTVVYDIGLKPILSKYASNWGANYESAKFAAYVGLWNGLVQTVAAIPEGIKLLTAIGKPNPEWEGIRQAVSKECGLPDNAMCFSGFLSVVWNGIAEMHDRNKPCVFAHAIGNDVFLLVSAYVSGGTTLAGSTAGNTIKTFLNVLTKLDVIGLAIGKATGITLKVVMQAGGKYVISFVTKAGLEVFRVVEQNGVKAFYYMKAGAQTVIDWSQASSYKLATLNGLPYKVHFGELLEGNLQGAKLQVKQYLKDADNKVLTNREGDALAVVGKEGSEGAEDNVVAVVKEGAEEFLTAEGKFLDNLLESDYQKYIARKTAQGKVPRRRLDWKEVRDYWLFDSPMARGNAFNDKAKLIYQINELNLKVDGRNVRVDSYVPPKNGIEGQIISRKAVNLEDIELSTFEAYLKEMQKKYYPGATIRSDVYPQLDGKLLEGKQYLQIPESNKNFSMIDEYIKLGKEKYGIEVIFLAE